MNARVEGGGFAELNDLERRLKRLDELVWSHVRGLMLVGAEIMTIRESLNETEGAEEPDRAEQKCLFE